ncbi:ankyrin repeat domain-containing protein [Bacillus sp. AK128]
MNQKLLIGILITISIICIYIWKTVFNMVDENTIEGLLSKFNNNSINQKDEHGWTSLMQASWDGDVEEVTELINSGANVNYFDDQGQTPLFLAAHQGHTNIVNTLIEEGASVSLNKITSDNTAPLFVAAENGHVDTFDFLIKSGATLDKEQRSKFYNYTMLHAAVRYGKFDMVEHLIELGFEPNSKDKDGNTPIMLIFGMMDTTAQDLIRMIDLLNIGGLELNIINNRGISPLLLSYYEGKQEVTDYLLKLGAEDAIQTKEDALEALNLLEINSDDAFRQSISFGEIGAVRLFLQAGFDPNIKSWVGNSILYQLAFTNEAEMMKLLLDHGADIELTYHNGITPLWIAVSQNNSEIVELLLSYGAQNTPNNAGWTPLMVAEDENNDEIIKLIEQYLLQERNLYKSETNQSSPIDQQNTDTSLNNEENEIYDIPEFAVYQNKEIIGRFYTEEEAIDFAKEFENVEVWYPNSTIWDNKPSRVYQNDQFIGDFDTKVEALEVASQFENAKVVNLLTQKVEWDSYPRECRTCESAIQDEY